jgi:hypothetical protein
MLWPWQLPAWLVCAVRGHQPLLERVRDAAGRASPHQLRWICRRCRHDLGETVLLIEPPRGDPS